MELITGYAGEPHIYPGDDAALNKGMLTADDVVLEVDEKFAYEIVYNNKIRVKSGAAIFQGRLIRIRTNQYDELTIENGTQALIRHDLIVARYSYDDGIESAPTVVIKGTPGKTGKDPEMMTGNIDQGDTVCDMPLYRVVINGLNIESVTPLFKTIKPMDWVEKQLEGKAQKNHTHTAEQITDLAKASVKHAESADAVAWGNVSGKPATFPPSAHKHAWDAITEKPEKFPPSDHDHNGQYYTKTEVNGLVNARVPNSRIKSHTWVTQVNGTSIDVNFSQVGLSNGKNYAIMVNNANRNAANLTVLGVSINQARTQMRIYWDQTTTGQVQFNLVAIEF